MARIPNPGVAWGVGRMGNTPTPRNPTHKIWKSYQRISYKMRRRVRVCWTSRALHHQSHAGSHPRRELPQFDKPEKHTHTTTTTMANKHEETGDAIHIHHAPESTMSPIVAEGLGKTAQNEGAQSKTVYNVSPSSRPPSDISFSGQIMFFFPSFSFKIMVQMC